MPGNCRQGKRQIHEEFMTLQSLQLCNFSSSGIRGRTAAKQNIRGSPDTRTSFLVVDIYLRKRLELE
jgi:hypothetical protein